MDCSDIVKPDIVAFPPETLTKGLLPTHKTKAEDGSICSAVLLSKYSHLLLIYAAIQVWRLDGDKFVALLYGMTCRIKFGMPCLVITSDSKLTIGLMAGWIFNSSLRGIWVFFGCFGNRIG